MSTSFIQRVQNLTPEQRQVLAAQLHTVPIASKEANATQRLAAYVVQDGSADINALRQHAKEKLPDYMMPSVIVELDELPRLPNGKINLNALPAPDEVTTPTEVGYVAPRTPTEQQLANIWAEILGFEPVGIHDNFFEIGGDSILSIQIIAKARKMNLVIAANQLFEHQTIAELALFVQAANTTKTTEETLSGTIPLLPIQHWFFEEHQAAPSYWNQAMLFTLPDTLEEAVLKRAIEHLSLRHDALRLCFKKINQTWEATILTPDAIRTFERIALSQLTDNEQDKTIQQTLNTIQSKFDLEVGSLFKGVFFNIENGQNKLLLIAHHLLVDNVSWQILLEDLKVICQQLQENRTIELPPKTTSYKKWGTHLLDLAKSNKFQQETAFWSSTNMEIEDPFLVDIEVKLPLPESSIRTLDFTLDAATTKTLLQEVSKVYNTRTDEVLIAALMQAIRKWGRTKSLCLGLERHGREAIHADADFDFSNSVGWFTTYFPVNLQLPESADAGILLKSVKEQLRQVPNGGLGYGVLRYLAKQDLRHRPALIFNFLGNQATFDSEVLGTGKALEQDLRAPKSERYHFLEVNALLSEEQLKLRWSYSEKAHEAATIEKLIQHFEWTLRELIEHCTASESGAYTPSDFPEADLSQDDLDQLLGNIEF